MHPMESDLISEKLIAWEEAEEMLLLYVTTSSRGG